MTVPGEVTLRGGGSNGYHKKEPPGINPGSLRRQCLPPPDNWIDSSLSGRGREVKNNEERAHHGPPPVIEAILVQPAPTFSLRLCVQDNGHATRDKSTLRKSATPQTRFSLSLSYYHRGER